MPVIYALGSNGSGQLGIKHSDDVNVPTKCIFKSSGSAQEGLEDGEAAKTLDQRSSARATTSDGAEADQVAKIVVGGNHTLVLTRSGRLFAAGSFRLMVPLSEGKKAGETVYGMPSTYVDGSSEFREITHALLDHAAHTTTTTSSGDSCEGDGPYTQITDVAATWDASFAVLDDRVVLCWGTGLKGELGLGQTTSYANNEARVVFSTHALGTDNNGNRSLSGEETHIKIISITATMAHVIVLLSNGHVYGWGSCRKGQLGAQYSAEKILWVPGRLDVATTNDDENDGDGRGQQKLLAFAPEKVVLGREYTVFLCAGYKPVLWGERKIFTPSSMQHLDEMVVAKDEQLVSGWSSIHHLLLSSGTVRSFGKNDRGQLAPLPPPLPGLATDGSSLPRIQTLAAGSEHCVALTAEGRVIAWGWGEHGNCGPDTDERGVVARGQWNEISLPRDHLDEAGGNVVKGVAAGCATTFLICGRG